MVIKGPPHLHRYFASGASTLSRPGNIPLASSVDPINLPFKEMVGLIRKSITWPASKTGINLIKKAPIILSFVWAPLLLFGLVMRRQLDQQMIDILDHAAHPEKKDPSKPSPVLNETLVNLSRIYPVALTGMMGSGVVNGFAYASFCRITPYSLLTASSALNAGNENMIIELYHKLLKLTRERDSLPAEEKEKRTEIQKQISVIVSEITDRIGSLDSFSRIMFPLWMSLTFFANVTQAAGERKEFDCKVPEGDTLNEMTESIRANFGDTMKKEFSAGWAFTKDLFSPRKWGEISRTFAGKDEAFEAKLLAEGKTGNFKETLVAKLRNPTFNRNFNLLNMYLKIITSIGSLAAVALWGSKKAFLVGDENYERIDPEVAKLAKEGKHEKAWVKFLFDAVTLIGNIGLAVLGFSSILQGLSTEYRTKTGQIPAALQLLGGVSVLLSAVFDQCKVFLTGAAFRFSSNLFLQLANALGACLGGVRRILRQA